MKHGAGNARSDRLVRELCTPDRPAGPATRKRSGRRAGRLGALFGIAASIASGAYADEAEIHTFHCMHGCPMGASTTNDLIVREIYSLSSNDRRKFADWVAYRVTADTVGRSDGRRWLSDPWLAEEETLEPEDYDDANEALGVDRGHQAPLAALSGTPFAEDTNVLSNITPQQSALNQSSWQMLEAVERNLITRDGPDRQGVVYVLTGPLYETVTRELPMPRGRERHRLPSGYWKVIALPDGRLSSFIFPQATPRRADFCNYRVGLEDVEIRADLNLFPRWRPRSPLPLDELLGCRPSEAVDQTG